MIHENRYFAWCVALVAAMTVLMAAARAGRAPPTRSSPGQGTQIVAVLQSDSPAAEKAITCKQLSVYGRGSSAGAGAAAGGRAPGVCARPPWKRFPARPPTRLLATRWARSRGGSLVGVIDSIGVRRNTQAVSGLAAKLKDADASVASAAAVALGCIGGEQAGGVLGQALADASPAVRPAVAQGCVRCAEKYLAAGSPPRRRSCTMRSVRPMCPSRGF